jgi:hypothetical protein
MTPKQKYDERRRLRAERLLLEERRKLRAEENHIDKRARDEEVEEKFMRIINAFERLADVAELWADQQIDRVKE